MEEHTDGPENTQPVGSAILFNARERNYGYLSTSYLSQMEIDGKIYYHAEGYYYASKHSESKKATEHIRSVTSPMAARKVSDSYLVSSSTLTRWNDTGKLRAMKRATLVKFATNTVLRDKLLITGNSPLIYGVTSDPYWGMNSDGNGDNMLGKILMEIRDIVRSI